MPGLQEGQADQARAATGVEDRGNRPGGRPRGPAGRGPRGRSGPGPSRTGRPGRRRRSARSRSCGRMLMAGDVRRSSVEASVRSVRDGSTSRLRDLESSAPIVTARLPKNIEIPLARSCRAVVLWMASHARPNPVPTNESGVTTLLLPRAKSSPYLTLLLSALLACPVQLADPGRRGRPDRTGRRSPGPVRRSRAGCRAPARPQALASSADWSVVADEPEAPVGRDDFRSARWRSPIDRSTCPAWSPPRSTPARSVRSPRLAPDRFTAAAPLLGTGDRASGVPRDRSPGLERSMPSARPDPSCRLESRDSADAASFLRSGPLKPGATADDSPATRLSNQRPITIHGPSTDPVRSRPARTPAARSRSSTNSPKHFLLESRSP